MTSDLQDKFHKEKVKHLLALIGSRSAGPIEEVDYEEYDWQCPRTLTEQQSDCIKEMLDVMTINVAGHLQPVCGLELASRDVRITEEFAEAVQADIENNHADSFFAQVALKFSGADAMPAVMILPGKTVFGLIGLMLGDEESLNDCQREPSDLEESLLQDIKDTILTGLNACEGLEAKIETPLSRGGFVLEASDGAEFCLLSLGLGCEAIEGSFEIFLLTDTAELTRIVTAENSGSALAPEAAKEAIISALQGINVDLTARFATASVGLGQMMALETGDILVLDKEFGEPVELLLNDRVIFSGQPAKCESRHAILITND